MPTCPPNLRYSFLTISKLIRSKVKQKVFFHCAKEVQQCFVGQKNHFGHRYGFPDFTFLFLVELGTCVQNLIFTKVVEGCQKKYFPQRGMLKFTYKGRFWTIKKAYEKILDWKSEPWKHALVPPLHVEIFIFEKY
jgi:hypothetical protein